MKFTVEMLAFGRPGEVREVDVPGIRCDTLVTDDDIRLQEIFRRGQNEFTPQPHPSVSAGDVINIGEDKWLVLAVGFKKLTPDEYIMYKEMSQSQRLMVPFTLKP